MSGDRSIHSRSAPACRVRPRPAQRQVPLAALLPPLAVRRRGTRLRHPQARDPTQCSQARHRAPRGKVRQLPKARPRYPSRRLQRLRGSAASCASLSRLSQAVLQRNTTTHDGGRARSSKRRDRSAVEGARRARETTPPLRLGPLALHRSHPSGRASPTRQAACPYGWLVIAPPRHRFSTSSCPISVPAARTASRLSRICRRLSSVSGRIRAEQADLRGKWASQACSAASAPGGDDKASGTA